MSTQRAQGTCTIIGAPGPSRSEKLREFHRNQIHYHWSEKSRHLCHGEHGAAEKHCLAAYLHEVVIQSRYLNDDKVREAMVASSEADAASQYADKNAGRPTYVVLAIRRTLAGKLD